MKDVIDMSMFNDVEKIIATKVMWSHLLEIAIDKKDKAELNFLTAITIHYLDELIEFKKAANRS